MNTAVKVTDEIKAFFDKFHESKKRNFHNTFKLAIIHFGEIEVEEVFRQLDPTGGDKGELLERESALKEVGQSLVTLEKEVQAAGAFLPGYDQRQYLQVLRDFGERLEKYRSACKKESRGKFTFTKKTRSTNAAAATPKEPIKEVNPALSTVSLNNAPTVNAEWDIFDINNNPCFEKRLTQQDSNPDICLLNCTDSCMKVYGTCKAIRIRNLRNCHVYLGPVDGSVFIDQCEGCHFHIACHQLRSHNVNNSNFYLHLTSKGIIEDCTGIRVSPYRFEYPNHDMDWRLSGLSREVNYWNELQDFNWLHTDRPSPNWTINETV